MHLPEAKSPTLQARTRRGPVGGLGLGLGFRVGAEMKSTAGGAVSVFEITFAIRGLGYTALFPGILHTRQDLS